MLGAHLNEKFVVPSEDEEDERVVFRLERVRRRFEHGKAERRYGFFVVNETELDDDDDPDDPTDCVISQDYPKLV